MKGKIRKEIFEKRNNHDHNHRIEKSRMIMENLFSMKEFREARRVMFYWPVKGEVDTTTMINEAMSMGKRVALPVTNTKEKMIFAFEIKSTDELEPGPFGILEPSKEVLVKPEEIDLVIVPGIAFDRKGNRIGYGHGYYDSFLKKTKHAVGLAYGFQLVKEIPANQNDMKVRNLITEEKVIGCE